MISGTAHPDGLGQSIERSLVVGQQLDNQMAGPHRLVRVDRVRQLIHRSSELSLIIGRGTTRIANVHPHRPRDGRWISAFGFDRVRERVRQPAQFLIRCTEPGRVPCVCIPGREPSHPRTVPCDQDRDPSVWPRSQLRVADLVVPPLERHAGATEQWPYDLERLLEAVDPMVDR